VLKSRYKFQVFFAALLPQTAPMVSPPRSRLASVRSVCRREMACGSRFPRRLTVLRVGYSPATSFDGIVHSVLHAPATLRSAGC
jgi:hypothetical protein